MNIIPVLKEEHSEMLGILVDIESYINNYDLDHMIIISEMLTDFGKTWDEHENKEEEFYETSRRMGKEIPNYPMFIEQHRELRGHWRVLMDSIDEKDWESLRVALDTDGRMLIEKFKKHISKEEEFFDELFSDD